NVQEKQAARIDASGVALTQAEADAQQFVRAIVPPPKIVPRVLNLDFRQPVAGSLRDVSGLGTGLTQRLPGTGARWKGNDVNLRLDTGLGLLNVQTTDSDLNTSYRLP